MFGDINRQIHDYIIFRNEPMCRLLRWCVEELEKRECEARVSLILRQARAVLQCEDAFHRPEYLDTRPEGN